MQAAVGGEGVGWGGGGVPSAKAAAKAPPEGRRSRHCDGNRGQEARGDTLRPAIRRRRGVPPLRGFRSRGPGPHTEIPRAARGVPEVPTRRPPMDFF